MYEYEFKFLGAYDNLKKLSDAFLHKTVNQNVREYLFFTYYYDTKDEEFAKKGFSLRFRPKNLDFPPVVDLKQVGGEEEGISKRIELTAKDLTKKDVSFLSLYFNLLSRRDYPDNVNKPRPSNLKVVFATEVFRKEVQAEIEDLGEVELALDKVKFLDEKGDEVGTDCELEIEIKSKNPSIKKYKSWFNKHFKNIYSDYKVSLSTQSKAFRAKELLNLKTVK
jgi:inorganic triphosphatase YgiF